MFKDVNKIKIKQLLHVMFVFYNPHSKFYKLFDIMFKLFVSYYCFNINNMLIKDNIQKDISTQKDNYEQTDNSTQTNISTQKNICIQKNISIQIDNNSDIDDFPQIPPDSFINAGQYLYDIQESCNKY
jgi:hypothetical protein